MILCVQACVSAAISPHPSERAGDVGLKGSLVPAGARTEVPRRRGQIPQVPCVQPRRKEGPELPPSEDKQDLMWMDNYSKVEIWGFLNKIIFNIFFC